jgi:phosphoketolase
MEYQRMMLKMNMERLRERSMTNHLLSSILKDYEAYEEKLKAQEIDHQEQMNYISKYIEDLIETNELTESGLNHAKYEQERIIKKINDIKMSLA